MGAKFCTSCNSGGYFAPLTPVSSVPKHSSSSKSYLEAIASSGSGFCSTYLPSDPNFLLEYMAVLASDDSDDDFNGYLLPDGEPKENSNNVINIIIHKYN